VFGLIVFKYLFPKPDGALSNWKSSRLDLSVPPGSRHNKVCCFILTALQLVTPVTQNTHCFRSGIFTSALAQVGTHCQFLTCRYNTSSYRRTIHPTTRRHIPEPLTQPHGVISQNHSPNDTVSSQKHAPNYTALIPRTTQPHGVITDPFTQLHGVISQNHSPNHTASYPRGSESSAIPPWEYQNFV